MSQIKLFRTDDFTGGLNLRADPFQLGQNESPDLLNVDVDPRGGFAIRKGFERANASAIGSIAAASFTPEKLFHWKGSSSQLLVAANSKVFYSTDTSTYTDTTIATTHAEGCSFAPWTSSSTKFVYCAVGRSSAQMAKWSGAAKTMLTASATGQWQESLGTPTGTHMPKADLACTHVDRMWVASTNEDATDYVNRIRFSHPNFPESWRSADYIDIPGGGSGITAIVPWGDALIVFKKGAVWALYGVDTATFQLVQIATTLGAETSHCVASTEHGLYFFSWPDGVFLWDGSKLSDVFNGLRPMLEDVNTAKLDQVWLSSVNYKVWLSLPMNTETTPSVTYVYDRTINAWTRHQLADGRGFAAATDFVRSTGARYVIGLHPTEPYALKENLTTWTDNISGTPANYSSYYITRWVDGGLISAKKMWRQPDFVLKQPTTDLTLTVDVYRDWEEENARRNYTMVVGGSGAGMVWGNNWGSNWGSAAVGSQYQKGQRLGLSRAVQLKVAGPGGRDWGINSITYKYNQRRIR